MDPILLKLEGGRYVSLILMDPLTELLAGQSIVIISGGENRGGRGGIGGGKGKGASTVATIEKFGASGRPVRVRYDTRLPMESF